MLKPIYYPILLICLSLTIISGCSKKSSIEAVEKEVETPTAQKEAVIETKTETTSDASVTEAILLQVSGMTWGISCVARVRSALTSVSGVVKAQVSMPTSAVVTIKKGEVSGQQLVDAVANIAGSYKAALKSTN